MPTQSLRRAAPTQTGGTAAPSTASAPTALLPFKIGSRRSSRFSFTLPATALNAGVQPLTPVMIPAVGYLSRITLEVTLTGSGGTTPAFTADAPFNVLSQVELRNSSGNDLIVPLSGFQLFCVNKYGVQGNYALGASPQSDPTYSATAPSAHFFIDVPCEVAPADAFGAIPALASNRSYQLSVSLAALATVCSGSPTINVTVNGIAWFWTEPTAATMNGVQQQTSPPYNGSLNLWQIEPQPVTPGDKYIKSDNVGNVIRTLIFTLRNAAGARDDTDWPSVCELYLDNNPMFYLTQTQWQSWMGELYGLTSATRDVANGLNTGVYVIPFFALAEGYAFGNARRSQYLPTLDASLLQLRGTSWGASASTLEVLTNSVVPVNPGNGSSSSALYAIS